MRDTLRAKLSAHRRFVGWLALGALAIVLIFIRFPGYVEKIDSYDTCAKAGYLITQSNPTVCHAPQRSYIGPAAPNGTPDPGHTSQPFETYVDGDSLNDFSKSQRLIDNQTDWESYWRAVHVGTSPVPPILPVDFKTHDIIAASEGTQLTDGYRLKITAILTGPAGSIVDLTEQIPTVGCAVKNQNSNRYTIVSTAKLVRPVSFAINTEYRQCTQ